MKESLTPYKPEKDKDFSAEEADNWVAPVPGEHVNFLVLADRSAGPSRHRKHQSALKEVRLRKRYAELGEDGDWKGIYETMDFNLKLLASASRGAFQDPSLRASQLELMTGQSWEAHIDEGNYRPGVTSLFKHPGAVGVGRVFTKARTLPDQTTAILDDLYALTNAKVVQDDRQSPGQNHYDRFLLGTYNGKQLLFVEQSREQSLDKSAPERSFAVQITDNMDALKRLPRT